MTGRLCCANKCAQDFNNNLDLNYKQFNICFGGHTTYRQLSQAAFVGCPVELEKTWALNPVHSLNYQVWCRGLDHVTAQHRSINQSARTLLRESAGTPSQWLSESKSHCRSTSTEGRLTCPLQVNNWGLRRVSRQGAADTAAISFRLA